MDETWVNKRSSSNGHRKSSACCTSDKCKQEIYSVHYSSYSHGARSASVGSSIQPGLSYFALLPCGPGKRQRAKGLSFLSAAQIGELKPEGDCLYDDRIPIWPAQCSEQLLHIWLWYILPCQNDAKREVSVMCYVCSYTNVFSIRNL